MKAGAIRGNGFYGALSYVFGDSKGAEIVAGNMSGTNPQQLSAEFGISRNKRPSIIQPVSHSWLRLPDNETIPAEKFSEIANTYMEQMGFGDAHQWVAVSHNDTNGQHIHIIASRIGLNGQLWNGRWEYFSAMRVASDLEKQFGLTITKTFEEAERDKKQATKNEIEKALREGRAPIRQQLHQIIDEALNEPQSVFAFIERLKASGVVVIPNVASTGRLNGMAFQLEGITFKGSQLGKGYSLKQLLEKGVSYEQATESGALIRYTNQTKKALSQNRSRDTESSATNLVEHQRANDASCNAERSSEPKPDQAISEAQQIARPQQEAPASANAEARAGDFEKHAVDHNLSLRAGYRRWRALDELFSNQGGAVSSMSYQHKMKELQKQFSAIQADKYELIISNPNSYQAPKRHVYSEQQLSDKMAGLMQLSSKGYVLQIAPRREGYFQFCVGDLSQRQIDKLEAQGYIPSLTQQRAPNDFEVVFSVPLYALELSQESLNDFAENFANHIGGEIQHGYHLSGFRYYGNFLTKILRLSALCCEKALGLVKKMVVDKEAPQPKPKMTISSKLYRELKRREQDNSPDLGL